MGKEGGRNPYLNSNFYNRVMNTHAALMMFAVIAAFGLATAALAVHIVPQGIHRIRHRLLC